MGTTAVVGIVRQRQAATPLLGQCPCPRDAIGHRDVVTAVEFQCGTRCHAGCTRAQQTARAAIAHLECACVDRQCAVRQGRQTAGGILGDDDRTSPVFGDHATVDHGHLDAQVAIGSVGSCRCVEDHIPRVSVQAPRCAHRAVETVLRTAIGGEGQAASDHQIGRVLHQLDRPAAIGVKNNVGAKPVCTVETD